jgi:hypothetical protein
MKNNMYKTIALTMHMENDMYRKSPFSIHVVSGITNFHIYLRTRQPKPHKTRHGRKR